MKQKKPWHYREILENMYVEQNLTLRQIAQILNTTATNILYWMRKFEIDTRNYNIGELNKGKILSKKEKELLSKIAKERFKNPKNHPMYGHRHTDEAKRKISETKKRRRRERLGAKI